MTEDLAMTVRLPAERPARVTIVTRAGGRRVGEVGGNRGDDADSYTHEEPREKFIDLTGRVWPRARGDTVLFTTLELCAGRKPLVDWTGLLGERPRA